MKIAIVSAAFLLLCHGPQVAEGFSSSSFLGTSIGPSFVGVSAPRTASSSLANGSGMTMRVGKSDMKRRQRLNNLVNSLRGDAVTAERVQTELLTEDTDALIAKCNWKLRTRMIRKVKEKSLEYDVEVASGFGEPPTQAERVVLEVQAGKERKEAKRLAFAKTEEQKQARLDRHAQSAANQERRKQEIATAKDNLQKKRKALEASVAASATTEAVAVVEEEPVVVAEEPVAEAAEEEPVAEAAEEEPVAEVAEEEPEAEAAE